MSEQIIVFTVEPPGERLDRVLAQEISTLSRNRVQQLIRARRVIVDGQVVVKPGSRVEGGERVELRIPAPRPAGLVPEAMPIDVLYEDENMLAINKPAGIVVHPSYGHRSGTLVQAVLAHAPDIEGIGGEVRPGVVHRLDKDTSGVILFAKNERAHRDLQDQFKARSVEKKYLALVDGHPPTPEGIVNAPIGRDVRHRKRMAVVADGSGRDAVTIFRTRERFIEHTLLGLEPKTGRTHQVRVHLAYVGCPIVGDRVYGHRRPSLPIERQFLHAMQLTIRLPGGADVRTFTAPVPADLEALLAQLHGNEVEN